SPFGGALVRGRGQGWGDVGHGDGEGRAVGGAVLVGDGHRYGVGAVVGEGVFLAVQRARGRGGEGGEWRGVSAVHSHRPGAGRPRVAEAAQVQGGNRPFVGRLVGRRGQGGGDVGDGDGEGALAGGAVLVGDRDRHGGAAAVGVGVRPAAQGA